MARGFVHVSGSPTSLSRRDALTFFGRMIMARKRSLRVSCGKRDLQAGLSLQVLADETFQVVSGEFQADGASEALLNEYVRIGYPTDTVPGSWQSSARNVKLQGSVLTAELQREDGSYVETVTSVLHWHFLQNVDGTLYIQRAPCASLGVCIYSYVLKINAKDLYCTRAASWTSTCARKKLKQMRCAIRCEIETPAVIRNRTS